MNFRNLFIIALPLAAFILLTYTADRVRWLDIRQQERDAKQNERILILEREVAEDKLVIQGGAKQFFDIRIISPKASKILEKLEAKK